MVDSPSDAWSPPPRFDGFELKSVIGQGGMGRVYLAHEEMLDRPVAIKFMLYRGTDLRSRERFLAEAKAVARLGHANVVAVYRIGEVDGQPYVAFEYVSGRSLEELPRPASWPDALRIGLGVTRALAAAHSRGVLHRDVKPANILESDAGELKLVDFGLAKLHRPSGGSDASDGPPSSRADARGLPGVEPDSNPGDTAAGILVGTPLYIAPEIWQGASASPASDVFALGLVLYELVTGAIPHAHGSPTEIALAVVGRDLPSIVSVRPDFPLALARVIEKALERRPAARFDSAVELLEALESLDAVLSRFRSLTPPNAEAPDGAARVVASLGRIGARTDELFVTVYEQLFARRPELRSLFPSDMSQQRAKLASALHLVVENLRCPEHIVALLEELGHRHIRYGATPEHLSVLGEALMVGLELHDPMPWDEPTRSAWQSAYSSISQGMERGFRSGTVTKPDLKPVHAEPAPNLAER